MPPVGVRATTTEQESRPWVDQPDDVRPGGGVDGGAEGGLEADGLGVVDDGAGVVDGAAELGRGEQADKRAALANSNATARRCGRPMAEAAQARGPPRAPANRARREGD